MKKFGWFGQIYSAVVVASALTLFFAASPRSSHADDVESDLSQEDQVALLSDTGARFVMKLHDGNQLDCAGAIIRSTFLDSPGFTDLNITKGEKRWQSFGSNRNISFEAQRPDHSRFKGIASVVFLPGSKCRLAGYAGPSCNAQIQQECNEQPDNVVLELVNDGNKKIAHVKVYKID